MTCVPKNRIRGVSGCRCKNLHRDDKLFDLVMEAVRDSNHGTGANPNQIFQHILKYHRVPLKDAHLLRMIQTSLAKALGSGFVRRERGRYLFVTNSRRQVRASRVAEHARRSRSHLFRGEPLLLQGLRGLLNKRMSSLARASSLARPSTLARASLLNIRRPSRMPSRPELSRHKVLHLRKPLRFGKHPASSCRANANLFAANERKKSPPPPILVHPTRPSGRSNVPKPGILINRGQERANSRLSRPRILKRPLSKSCKDENEPKDKAVKGIESKIKNLKGEHEAKSKAYKGEHEAKTKACKGETEASKSSKSEDDKSKPGPSGEQKKG